MSYKHNRLRTKLKNISKARSIAGKRGNEVKAKMRIERASEMRVVGGCRTYGIFGEHHIEFLNNGHEELGVIRFDGRLRNPHTVRGFVAMLGRWLWKPV